MFETNENGSYDPRRTQRRVWTPEPPQMPVENTRATQRMANVTPPPVSPNGTRRINSDNKKPPKWLWLLLVFLLVTAAVSWFVSNRVSEPLVFVEEEELIEDDEYPVVDEYEYPDENVEATVVEESPATQPVAVVEDYSKPPVSAKVVSEVIDEGPCDTVIEFDEEVVVRNDSPQEETEKVYTMAMVEQKPSFPGGDAAMYKWLGEHINYPAQASEEGVQGRVIVMFDVDKTGQIVNIKITRGRHPALDKEAIRLVKSMPKWQPARNNGQPVCVTYTLPIIFKL